MSLAIMIQGTASDVGKSMLVAGLCRIFAQDGLRTAPFKSQNMALNSGITPDGKEMGRAQIFQAEAAGIAPDVRMNPVLLKPTSDCKAQVVLMGKVATNMDAVTYHNYKPQLKTQIREVYQSLASEHDVMVLEGAGSPAEINLRDRDIVNMGMAELAECPVVLVADIDRGGVFAAIYGTIALLLEHEKWRIKGVIINKFRGDVALLYSGIEQIEALTSVPVLGVMPWLNVDLEDEDSVVLDRGKYDSVSAKDLDIAVLQLPYMSNFTDFNALAAQPDVRLRYVVKPDELANSDLVIVPGSKNTLGDLRWVRENGLEQALLAHHRRGGAVLGICGGYQMLGQHIYDEVESGLGEMPGMGLLDVITRFANEKTTTRVSGHVQTSLPGVFAASAGRALAGYEIHMGETQRGAKTSPFATFTECNTQPYHNLDGAVSEDGRVLGTYLHGVFDSGEFTRSLLDSLRLRKGLNPWEGERFDYQQHKEQQFNILADALREHIDIARIYQIMREHQEQSV
ncbi:cobyric acid synthase [Buttiauxella sp. WJP83]|uniref:cobyric acid synthase n=1 Tax=Buttiauxella sp. WJP83 TaxID=2986951 RepID=UPI0022DD952C|nr:cobyric acid synthase [Buttiauxella sp. WJP83]WBM72124.1 cobyric acid synthase [Buttiauxella sp. WJP83]